MRSETLFMVMVDVEPASVEHEFNIWYNEEHVPELLRVPGFLTAQRFRTLQGSPKYVAMYDLANIGALDEPLFHQARPAHPMSTPATKKMWAHVRNLRRGIYRRFAAWPTRGVGTSAPTRFRLLVGIDVDEAAEAAFEAWLSQEHLPDLANADDVGAAGYRLDSRSTDHKDPPGRYILVYDLGQPDAGRDPRWLKAPGMPWAAALADPSKAVARLFYERIYPL